MSQSQEYVVRVPRENSKKYSVMRFSTANNVDISKWKSAKLERENNMKEVKQLDEELPKFGAGSEFGKDLKDEAKKKKFGRKFKPQNQPWILLVNGKSGRKFKGLREGSVSDNTSYYVFFQAHDGAFEAFPVDEWYKFTPIPKYKALTAEEAEEQFEKRDKILNYFTVMNKNRKDQKSDGFPEEKQPKKKRDFKVTEMDEWAIDSDFDDDIDSDNSESESKTNNKKGKLKKNLKEKQKKKKDSDDDRDSEPLEESDEGDFDQREVDYMSTSSSDNEIAPEEKVERELKGVEDEAALRQLVLTDEEDEENEEEKKDENSKMEKINEDDKKNEVDKKVKVKTENELQSETSASSSDSDDSDFDSKFQSAMFMQKKYSKSKNSSDQSAGSSRPNTPLTESMMLADSMDCDKKMSIKRKNDSQSTSTAKKAKVTENIPDGITEESVRRYLMRKPMTTTELLQRFKNKRISMSSSDFLPQITQILKKLNPDKKTIKGKLYLYIKSS